MPTKEALETAWRDPKKNYPVEHNVKENDNYYYYFFTVTKCPQWLSGQESACNAGDAGDAGLIPGLGRSPGGGHGNPLQYPCLEIPMDRGAWQATIQRVAKSQT